MSIPDVASADGFHGNAAQERLRGEAAGQIRHALRQRRPGHLQHHLPRRGPVRHGHLHARGQFEKNRQRSQ